MDDEARCQCDPCARPGVNGRCRESTASAEWSTIIASPNITATHCARCINYCLADD